MSFSEEIVDAFLAYDFRPDRKAPDFEPAFLGEYETKLGIFRVRFSSICADMTNLPEAYIVSFPDSLSDRVLSNINADGSLCYIDRETSNIFPLDAAGAIATCIHLVNNVINLWVDGKVDESLQAEFSSYWQGKYPVFKVGDNNDGVFCQFERKNLSGESCIEFVLADDEQQAKDWVQSRDGADVKTFYPALIQNLKNNLRMPNGISWPPRSLGDLLKWLGAIDQDSYGVLVGRLIARMGKHHNVIICLTHGDEIFAALIKFTQQGYKVIERARGSKRTAGGRGKRKRSGGYKLNQLSASLCSMGMTKSFVRLRVEEASPSFIFQRNQPQNHSLIDKRIALIGCGTIGGYAAQALSQCGAGGGLGSFHLFDGDTFNAGNLGRHILGKDYLLESKSHSVKHFLDNQKLPISVVANDEFTNKDIEGKWDIIIDATGDDTFSILLSSWYRSHYQSKEKRPTLIHGWVDAYGKAARVLKDSGDKACYGCLSNFNGNQRLPRFPLFSEHKAPDHNKAFRRHCGRTFLPFSSQSSLTAA
ncbi:MAG: ThiF family adenylyltransferase, partial [Motiliproteus sp.]|nr:ThiF family adenylyltransferase [Motiliproteus sp.]